VVRFTPPPGSSSGGGGASSTTTTVCESLGGPLAGIEAVEEKKYVALAGNQTPIARPSAYNIIVITTAL
jgi:hypothetical protein